MQIVSEKLSDQKYLSLFMALWSCHPRPSRVGVVRAISRQVPSAVMTEHRLSLSRCHRKKDDQMNEKMKLKWNLGYTLWRVLWCLQSSTCQQPQS